MDYKKLFKKIIRKVYSGIETIVVTVAPTLEYLKDKRVAFKSKVGDGVYYGIKFLMVLVLIYIFLFFIGKIKWLQQNSYSQLLLV